ncbi:hypothetical protein [Cytobacillus oceanisediminis]
MGNHVNRHLQKNAGETQVGDSWLNVSADRKTADVTAVFLIG